MLLPILELENTAIEQLLKVEEEFNELKHCFFCNDGLKPKEQAKFEKLEENWDTIQALIGLMLSYATSGEIEQSNKWHIDKLQNRVGTKNGHPIKGYIKIEFVEV